MTNCKAAPEQLLPRHGSLQNSKSSVTGVFIQRLLHVFCELPVKGTMSEDKKSGKLIATVVANTTSKRYISSVGR